MTPSPPDFVIAAEPSSQRQQEASSTCPRCSANPRKASNGCFDHQEIVLLNSSQQQQNQQRSGCTCPEKSTMRSLSFSAAPPNNTTVSPDSSDANAYKEYIDNSFGCNITPQPSISDPAYSWAVVSPQSSATIRRNENVNMGFVFQKPHSSVPRFFGGQPKSPRRRPTARRLSNRHPRPSCSSSGYLSDTSLSSSSPTSIPMLPSSSDMGFPLSKDDPLQPFDGQLHHPISEADRAVAAAAAAAEDEALVRDLALTNADELTALLNEVLTHEDKPIHNMPSLSLPPSTSSSTSTSSTILPPRASYCGSFAPQLSCRPTGTDQGESVVITITPLSKSGQNESANRMTTRIVTCYCGPTCTCPGCFVHPGNFFLGNGSLDPYAGLFSAQRASSSTSSSYSSDDDDRRL
ncbi:hypothetical protein DFQ28_008564 [Apophysomyces sp. BC1034]|nr:hypothetical protein DFQ28_008564 [Apophysomyces sp. BC1034]